MYFLRKSWEQEWTLGFALVGVKFLTLPTKWVGIQLLFKLGRGSNGVQRFPSLTKLGEGSGQA